MDRFTKTMGAGDRQRVTAENMQDFAREKGRDGKEGVRNPVSVEFLVRPKNRFSIEHSVEIYTTS